MKQIVAAALHNYKTTLCLLLMIILAGLVARSTITVEADPDITIPIVMILIPHPGISPEDADRLIVRPIESEVRALEGIEEVTATSQEGAANLILEFDIDFDADIAIAEVRAAVDRAQAKIPSTSEEPIIKAITMSDQPVIAISLASDTVPERVLYGLAVNLKYDLESLTEVLEARLSGHREELLEAIIDPRQLEYYQVSQQEMFNAIRNNNRLIAAGALDTGQGRFAVKVPGLIETREDIFGLPIKVSGDTVVTLDKIAQIRRTFKDRQSYTRVNGVPAITVAVLRRPGMNIIDMNEKVRRLVKDLTADYPSEVSIIFSQDQAPFAEQQVTELQGNIVTAMALVMILVVSALGLRSGILVGAAVPVSFLFGLLVLQIMGLSFNFMVMFGMLLGLGMLIDGAIVVVEYADRKMVEGMHRRQAYLLSAHRMLWPVLASTATTLAAFLPLFYWPGVSGQFMMYLPITVFAVLIGSLLYALIFAPTLGSLVGKAGSVEASQRDHLSRLEHGDLMDVSGLTGRYIKFLNGLLKYPITVILCTVLVLMVIFRVYSEHGAGFIFFTDTEPTYARVNVSARGNFSRTEIRDFVLEAEQALMPMAGVDTYFTSTRTGGGISIFGRGSAPVDMIGSIFMDFENARDLGTTSQEILELTRSRLDNLVGINTEIAEQEYGPSVGKDIQIQIASKLRMNLEPVVERIRAYLDEQQDLRDIEDTRVLPGIDWELVVDRAKAAEFNVNVSEVGSAVQLITNGLYLGEYRPDDAVEEVEIRLRYPKSERNLHMLDQLRVASPNGAVPISHFVQKRARSKLDTIVRVDGNYVMSIRANVLPGVIADSKVTEIQHWIDRQNFSGTRVSFRGAAEEQDESMRFVGFAFLMALLLMFVLLVTQFNSFYQAFMILSAVVMSTAGVLLGLLTFNQTFSTILTGIGIVALAGIVVNNNIVLIDTYNVLRKENPRMPVREVIVRTGAQRLRPVFLTTATTILGLLPLASNVSIDLINRTIVYGGHVSAYWVKLASSIVYGLTFATVLTLLITPLMLILPQRLGAIYGFVMKKLGYSVKRESGLVDV